MTITAFEPKKLWRHFAALSAIPRGSKREEKASLYVIDFAKKLGLQYRTDSIGNVVIYKGATEGYESIPTTILQGHLDMVWQKSSESTHNFEEDGIELKVRGEWLTANETTLGADNGIGVAAALALLEEEIPHGALEILLTVDEEAGMGGVRHLAADWLSGEYLLNLDSEQFGSCCIGSAGGVDFELSKELPFEENQQGVYLKVKLSGARGGHSGLDIDKGYGNANQLLARALNGFSQKYSLRLATYYGGTLRNAIPREAEATIAIDQAHLDAFKEYLKECNEALAEYYIGRDDAIILTMGAVSPLPALDPIHSRTVLDLMTLLPSGVERWSYQFDLPESSCNIGVVHLDADDHLTIKLLARALSEAGLREIEQKVRSLALLTDTFMEVKNPYPAWTPDEKNPLLPLLQNSYLKLFDRPISVEVLHAGLETGFIKERYPNLAMISFGPTIEGAHSPKERVNIESVAHFYQLLKDVITQIE